MSVIQIAIPKRHRCAGCTHSAQFRMLARVGMNRGVRILKSDKQCFTRIGRGMVQINIAHSVDRDAAGNLPAHVAAHAVRNNRQPADSLEIFIARGFDVAKIIFVLLALTADV